jgi:Beta propeller domain
MTPNKVSFARPSAFALGLIICLATVWMSESAPVSAAADRAARPGSALVAFRSDAELLAFLKRHVSHARASMPTPAPPAMVGAQMDEAMANTATVTAEKASGGITNNQEAGVDEGDIVKVSGDILIVLRRGRLFTLSIARGGMHPLDAINAYPPGVDARDDWYDELLVAGDHLVVIGYSYARGGTEINRFQLSRDGRLAFIDAHQLRSNDYYSSRNYASRLIGHKLILYSPLYLEMGANDPLDSLPAMRRWAGGGNEPGFHRIVGAQQVYIPAILRDTPNAQIDALHTVTTCDVTAPELNCSAMSVLGPDSRSFYVSGQAVYVWLSDWASQYTPSRTPPPSLLYRLPLDGSQPSAIGVRGAPIDQFSFREDVSDGVLNVLVRSEGGGDTMWHPEFTAGHVDLLRVPLQNFGDGSREADYANYRALPSAGTGDIHDRFVGNYLLYGAGNDFDVPVDGRAMLVAAPVRGGRAAEIPLMHAVDRIEAMGSEAVVVGSDATNVTFTAIELASGAPRAGDSYSQPGSQSETRSHGFFFNPDADGTGILGLPVARPVRAAYRQLFENSASILFLRRANQRFLPLGELDARTDGAADDNCVASCTDWYGNARPVFYQGRTFALLGYELVEGALSSDAIREKGRTSFAPNGFIPVRSER